MVIFYICILLADTMKKEKLNEMPVDDLVIYSADPEANKLILKIKLYTSHTPR